MSEGLKVPYADAKKVADDLLVLLGGHFKRLEIAGSLRRKKEFVGDIELVGILQLMLDENSFFANEISPIGAIIDLMRTFGYKTEKAGEKYIKFISRLMSVDLFLCTPETWGCIFMIRTGSAEFTRKMVTKKRFGGWCPDNMDFQGGRLWNPNAVVWETPEEEDVFRALGLAYVPPEQRSL